MGEKISFIDLFGTELELEDEYAREMLTDESAARAEDVAVLEARMDTFTALPAGSTSGDAELMDIRVGANGKTYANAGDAVRTQLTNIVRNAPSKEPFKLLDDTFFEYEALTPYQTVEGWKLTGDGYCDMDSSARLVKYVVPSNGHAYLRLKKDTEGVYQFQYRPSVPASPSSGPLALLGDPCIVPIDGIIKTPETSSNDGKCYLIVSEKVENESNIVAKALPNFDKTAIDAFFNNTIKLQSGGIYEGDNYDNSITRVDRATAKFIPISGIVTIECSSNYEFWAYQYDAEKKFLNDSYRWTQSLPISALNENCRYITMIFRDHEDHTKDISNEISTIEDGIKITPAFSPDFREMLVMSTGFHLYKNGTATMDANSPLYIYGPDMGDDMTLSFFGVYAYTQLNFDFSSQGQTLIFDTSAVRRGFDGGDASLAFKVVQYGQFDRYCIPIANYRNGMLFVSGPFLQFVDIENEEKIERFKEQYYPYSMHNDGSGWKSRVNIMHISDTHVGADIARDNLLESISVGNELAHDGTLNAVVNTGDHTNGMSLDKTTFLSQYANTTNALPKSDVPYLMLLGNHDANNAIVYQTAENVPTNVELYPPFEYIFSQQGVVAGDSTNKKRYHYYDVTSGGNTVRIIMLDMLDHPDYDGTNTNYDGFVCVYSQAQIDWLANIALNVPDDYGVIICNHFPFAPNRGTDWSEIYPNSNGTWAQGWTMIPEIVEAWQNRTTLSKTYIDTVGSQNIVANYDFSNVPNGAEFVCYLVGHLHSKNTYTVKEENGVEFDQLMLCEDSSGQQGTAVNRVYKHFGTVSGIAFSVLSIDMDEKKIYRTSYGVYKKCNDPTVQQTQVFNYDFSSNN